MNFSKDRLNPVFWIGVLLLLVIAYVYFMNEGYVDASGSRVDASGSVFDSSGSTITLSLSDLIKALSFSSKSSSNTITTPSTTVVPIPVSGSGSDKSSGLDSETEKRLSKNIATQIKDELLAQRATTPVETGCGSASGQCGCASDACSQGSEYLANSPGAPFDSADYIRKDSIPCWGCSLAQ